MSAAARTARIVRNTSETQIDLTLELDGSGEFTGSSGIGFFDHMLSAFSRHGLFGLSLACSGDLHIDQHHTVEDVGICLGQALDQAVGDKVGIHRFGQAHVPMDEALARAVVDISGRGCLVLEAAFREGWVGEFPVSLAREFFTALAHNGKISLHLDLLRGSNDHHSVEAIFKACARALDEATGMSGRSGQVPSTKGSL
jgi:imidazoleglycerol-phosphate dehydratase